MRPSLRRALVSFALVGLSAAPVLAASDPSRAAVAPAAASVDGSGLAAQVWSWIRTILPDSGCGIDPSGGNCVASAPRPGTPAGAAASPPRPTPAAGKVRPTAGCGIDPGGSCQ